jgi:hypothetical protein
MASYLINYAIAFVMTVALEVVVALALGYRKQAEVACVVCVNFFSWPLVNYLIWIAGSLQSAPVGTPGILLFEVGVVIVEWLLLCYALPQRARSRLFVLSLAMNGVSYSAGYLIPWV